MLRTHEVVGGRGLSQSSSLWSFSMRWLNMTCGDIIASITRQAWLDLVSIAFICTNLGVFIFATTLAFRPKTIRHPLLSGGI